MFDNTISPVLGGSGGGGSAVPFVPSVSPFTDEAGRDTWGAANLDQLFNNTNKFTQIEVGVESERWGGEDMPSTYDATKWIPASVGDTAGTIRNKLESLAGDNRLDATAIKDLDVSAKGLLAKVYEVAQAEKLSHGDSFSESGANDFIKQIGLPASFSTVSTRQKPIYYSSGGSVGFFGGNGDDPTDPASTLMEIVVPKEFFTKSQEIRITSSRSSANETRKIWAYNGDATAGGTELPITLGEQVNATTNSRTRYFNIPASSDDVHIYVSRQIITDIALPNKVARWGSILAGTKLSAATAFAVSAANFAHGETLSFADADSGILGMGLGASWRRTNDRIAPNVYHSSSRFGVYGGAANADETGDVQIMEIIIPAFSLQHDMVLEMHREAVSSGVNGQKITVYSGDPTTTGVKLTPIHGNEEHTAINTQSTISWNVSTTPDAESYISQDLHICIGGQVVYSIDILKSTHDAATVDHVDELRGGPQPAAYSTSTTYNTDDEVLHLGYSWTCKQNAVTGVWDATKWEKATILDAAKHLNSIDIEVNELRGSSEYDVYDATATDYSAGDFVHEPTTGKNWKSKNAITSPAGAFDSSLWFEASVESTVNPTQHVELLESLAGDNRLDATAIKGVTNGLLPRIYNVATRESLIHEQDFSYSGMNEFIQGMGVPARFDTALGRVRPRFYSVDGDIGFTTGYGADDPTDPNLAFVEIHIENQYFTEANKFYATAKSTSSSGDRRIWVFNGNATTGGTEITPSYGNSINEDEVNFKTVVYDIPKDCDDLYIYVTRQVIVDLGFINKDAVIGDLTHNKVVKEQNPNNRWVNLASWDAIATGTADALTASLVIYGKSTTSNLLIELQLRAYAGRGIDHFGGLSVTNRVSNFPEGTAEEYRLLRESSTTTDKVHLQFLLDIDETFTWTIVNSLPVKYGSDASFGSLDIHTPIAGEVVIKKIDVSGWVDEDISTGVTGGIECDFVGNPSATGSNIQFHDDRVIHRVGQSKTLEAFEHGLLVSGSATTTHDSPAYRYDSSATPNINIIDTEFGTLSMDVDEGATGWVSDLHQHLGGDTVPGFTMPSATPRMTFTVPAVTLLVPDITATLTVGVTTSFVAQGAAGVIEFLDSSDNSLQVITVNQPTNKGEYQLITIDYPTDGIIKVKRGASGGVYIGILSASWSLVQLPKNKSDHLVLDVRSNTRALGLPKAIDFGDKTFEEGNLRADPLTGRAQTYVAGGWNYLESIRAATVIAPYSASYYADVGTGLIDEQGDWELNASDTGGHVTVVENQYGYDQLLHIVDNTTAYPVGIHHNLSSEAQVNMGTRGFRWDFSARIDAGSTTQYIQVTDDFKGTAGRWLLFMAVSGDDLTITAETGGGTAIIPASAFHTYSVILGAGDTEARLYIDGVQSFGIPFNTASYTTSFIIHSSGSTSSADEDFWIRDTTFFTATNSSRTFHREDIEASIRFNIPTIPNEVTMYMPKGTFAVGTQFTIVNGSNLPATLESQVGDIHLFEGESSIEVNPNNELVFTQSASPRGCTWTTLGGHRKTTVHSMGHSLQMTVSSTGALLSRHGSYTGNINIVKLTTGQYQLQVGSFVFANSNSTLIPSAHHGSVAHVAVGDYTGGYPEVRIFDFSAAQVDTDFTVALYW